MIRQFYWALKSKFERQVMLVYRLHEAMPLLDQPDKPELQPLDAVRLRSLLCGPTGKDLERLGQGHQLLAFVEHNDISARLWLTSGHVPAPFTPWECGLTLKMSPGLDYIWDCVTAPAQRNRGLYARGLTLINAAAVSAGREVAIYCRENNMASRRVIERVGFKLAERLDVSRFGLFVRVRGERHRRWYLVRQSVDLLELIRS